MTDYFRANYFRAGDFKEASDVVEETDRRRDGVLLRRARHRTPCRGGVTYDTLIEGYIAAGDVRMPGGLL